MNFSNHKFNKNDLWILITRKINHSLHRFHVFSIINILIEELIIELKNGKKIIIPNFGVLEIKNLKPKKIKSIKTGKLKFAKKTKALRFSLARKLSKFLIKNL